MLLYTMGFGTYRYILKVQKLFMFFIYKNETVFIWMHNFFVWDIRMLLLRFISGMNTVRRLC